MNKFRCPLCGKELPIQLSKKNKPYITCPEDGLQMFVRYEQGIRRLEEMANRDTEILQDYVICKKCNVAVRKSLKKVKDPFIGKAGLYCPECEKLLLEAPEDWKEKIKP
jgi:transcription elongation factor Elf1